MGSTSLRHPDDHVVDQTFDSVQTGNVLASALPDSQGYFRLGLARFSYSDIHVHMSDDFRERSPWTSHFDNPRLDLDSDTFRNIDFFGLEDVAHLKYRAVSNMLSTGGRWNPSVSRCQHAYNKIP